MADSIEELKHKVAQSSRILAMMGLVKDTLGHVSVRIPGTEDQMLVRCRGPQEAGLTFCVDDDVRRTDFNGNGSDLEGGYFSPGEVSIHGESMRLRSEVNCVIHAHPPGALMCGIGGVEFRPIIGSYDGGFTIEHSISGTPIFPHAYLISRPELAHRLIYFMGKHNVCVMKGHGVTITGTSVEDATIRALKFESMCRIHWQLALAGRAPQDVSIETLNENAKRMGESRSATGLSERTPTMVWDYYVRMSELTNGVPLSLGVPDLMI